MSAPQPFLFPAARSRINRFVLHRPGTIAEACTLLERHGDDAKVHAGGLNVVTAMKEGRGPGHLVHIAGMEQLRGIAVTDEGLRIGAAVTHQEIVTNSLIGNLFPAFADYVEGLGNIRIRMQGTIGGNILADQPLYEVRPLLFVTDAMLEFVDVEGRRIQVTPDAVMRAKLPRTLLSAIIVPLKPVHLAWARELRPHLSVVVAHAASQDDRVAVVGAPSGFAGLRVPREGASAAIDRWFATVEFSSTEDEAIYLRRAARVLLQRCLARAAREP